MEKIISVPAYRSSADIDLSGGCLFGAMQEPQQPIRSGLCVGVGRGDHTRWLISERDHYLHDVAVGTTFVRIAVLGVFEKDLIHVGASVLEQFVARIEDDDSDFTVAKDRQLVSFLHEAEFAFG